jgi:hypothetical protein
MELFRNSGTPVYEIINYILQFEGKVFDLTNN